MDQWLRFQVRLAPERLHLVKCILEGYGHLAMLSTLDPARGQVCFACPASREQELRALLAALGLEPPAAGPEEELPASARPRSGEATRGVPPEGE